MHHLVIAIGTQISHVLTHSHTSVPLRAGILYMLSYIWTEPGVMPVRMTAQRNVRWEVHTQKTPDVYIANTYIHRAHHLTVLFTVETILTISFLDHSQTVLECIHLHSTAYQKVTTPT